MKQIKKLLALALGSVLAVSLAACGGEETPLPPDDTTEPAVESKEAYARICYDNLPDDGLAIDEADTKVAVENATSITGYSYDEELREYTKVANPDTIATYENGVFTAVGKGIVTFKIGELTSRIEVVPAYVTNPGNQYKSLPKDLKNDTSELLGGTHDPSLIEVNERGIPTYYIFSTGWEEGNEIRRSYDLVKWELLGKATHGNAEAQIPAGLREWACLKDNEGVESIQWWAPDIVACPSGGYWLYTCTVQPDDHMPTINNSNLDGAASSTGCKYSQASIVQYWTDSLDKDWKSASFEYRGVLMQSAIPQDGTGTIDINSIDPQIIYDDAGNMYMAYGSFGTGNWLLELDPETGLRKDGVYADGQFKSVGFIRKERNKVVSGNEAERNGTKYQDDFLAGKEVKSDFYGRLISLGAMEAPVLAKQEHVTTTKEDGTVLASDKTYYYSMHSYNWLAQNYQMWGGRSESIWGVYKSVNGGVVYNVGAGNGSNQGNKYMGAFHWRNESMSAGNKEINIALPGHNDIFTTNTGLDVAAYITRTWDNIGESFAAQIHQYYLNSYGDIVINPNRYGGEVDRSVSKDELLKYTDGGRFEMVVLANQEDLHIDNAGDDNSSVGAVNTTSVEVVFTEDGKIKQGSAEIGTWMMYGKGYIKLEFTETLKATSGADSGEKVYYGVVRPAWLGNRNQSGFTITAMGHTQDKMSMPLFLNNYSTLSGSGLVG